MATLQDINAELEAMVKGKRPQPKPTMSDFEKFKKKPTIEDFNKFRSKKPQVDTVQVDQELKKKGVPVDDSFFGTAGRVIKDIPSDAIEAFRASKEAIKKGAEDVEKIKSKMAEPTGGVAGAVERVSEPIGAFFKPIVNVLGEGVMLGLKAFTTDEFEKEISKKFGDKIAESETVKKIAEWWSSVPEADKNIISNTSSAGEFLFDLVGGTGVKRGTKKVVEELSEQTARSARELGEELVKRSDEAFIKQAEDVVTPRLGELTKKQRAARIGDVEEGIFKRAIKPTPAEREAAEEVAKLLADGKLKTRASTVKNYKAIDDAIGSKAKKLELGIAASPKRILKEKIEEAMQQAIKKLDENTLIVGDAKKKAEKIVDIYKKTLGQEDITNLDLLKARKQGDSILKKQTKGRSFDPDSENALTVATREIRDVLNDTLIKSTDDIDIKESLKQQSALFRARDVLEERFSGEAAGVIGRVLQAIQTKSGIPRSEVAELLILFGGTQLIPSLTTTAVPAYGVLRLVEMLRSPKLSRSVGNLLKKSKNPNARKALNEFQDFRKGFLPTSSLRKQETEE